mmetsp:Transcript_25187/g.53618  ORF Transcript_25187/g.53618 Transcript_25187/m.53618 type:complete len:247 (+) Transcript_25187:1330-2070(+)
MLSMYLLFASSFFIFPSIINDATDMSPGAACFLPPFFVMESHNPSFPDFLFVSSMPGIVCRMGGPLGLCLGRVRVKALLRKAIFSSSVMPPPFMRRMRSCVSSYMAFSASASLPRMSSALLTGLFLLDSPALKDDFLSKVSSEALPPSPATVPPSPESDERGLSISPADPGDCKMECRLTSSSVPSPSPSPSSFFRRIFLFMKERMPMDREVSLRDELEAQTRPRQKIGSSLDHLGGWDGTLDPSV